MTIDRDVQRAAMAAALVLGLVCASTTRAATCVGFTDVDSASSFCKNVEWLKNRKVTSGCTANTYCPTAAVTRAQMAIFMNRLGTALTTQHVAVDQSPGAIVLPASDPVRMCETGALAAADFPRVAAVRGTVTGLGNASSAAWRATLLVSTDGATWNPLDATLHATAQPGAWSYAAPIAARPIVAGETLRVAIGVRRDDIVTGTTGNFADSRCQLVVDIDNVNGSISPFDVADEGDRT